MSRETPIDHLRRRVDTLFHRYYEPGFGRVSDATDPAAAPDGSHIAFTAIGHDALDAKPWSRIAVVDVEHGNLRHLGEGRSDRLPKWSPDGRLIAYLEDRAGPGDAQLCISRWPAEGQGGKPGVPGVDGVVEAHHWSPSGRQILLTVAGRGADVPGAQGGITTAKLANRERAWFPDVDTGDEANLWRHAWIYDLDSGRLRRVSPEGLTIWECAWCGDDAIVAVASPAPQEGAWYAADLVRIGFPGGDVERLLHPREQIGAPTASASGRQIAVLEAVCSDRTLIAGDITLIDSERRTSRHLDAGGIDVSCVVWLDEQKLMIAGQRGFETVVATIDATSGARSELWSSRVTTSGYWYPSVSPLGPRAFAMVAEAYDQPPAIVLGRDGALRRLLSLEHEGTAFAVSQAGSIEELEWAGDDGTIIQGWLIRPPEGRGPFATVMDIHGGPVWAHRCKWNWRSRTTPLLTGEGYAVFRPNPRGSSTRGQDFVRALIGDMGGVDVRDCLAGIDLLTKRGISDSKRLGVTGGSYGGFLTSSIITKDRRFAAAIAISPITDWYSQHRTSQIPHFDKIFLAGDPSSPGGPYHERSPVMFAHRARTPTLFAVGALDRNTPPTQAYELCRSLRENGVPAQTVCYPQEGHGIRQIPASLDLAERTTVWFDRYMPARAV